MAGAAWPAHAGIEMSNLFNGVNVNKTGITLDLTSADGRALLRPLVEAADVLVENFSTRVMGNFGLTDDVLHEWNPRPHDPVDAGVRADRAVAASSSGSHRRSSSCPGCPS